MRNFLYTINKKYPNLHAEFNKDAEWCIKHFGAPASYSPNNRAKLAIWDHDSMFREFHVEISFKDKRDAFWFWLARC